MPRITVFQKEDFSYEMRIKGVKTPIPIKARLISEIVKQIEFESSWIKLLLGINRLNIVLYNPAPPQKPRRRKWPWFGRRGRSSLVKTLTEDNSHLEKT